MKKISLCLTLFCTTLIWVSPILAAQEVDSDYTQKPSSIKRNGLHPENSRSLLEDLSMLAEFDIENRQAEQLLQTKFDEEDKDLPLQQALDESQVYEQSLISYDAERPQRIDAIKEKMAKSVEEEIIELKRQLSDTEAKVRTLSLEVITKGENQDPTWDTAVDSFLAALREQEEQRARLLPIIEQKTSFLASLTRKWGAPREESVGIPSPQAAATTQQTESTDVIPVRATRSFPALPSSALPSLSFSSGGSNSSSADK